MSVPNISLEVEANAGRGGNDPAIVCPNVDIDTVVANVRSFTPQTCSLAYSHLQIGTLALYNSGQVKLVINSIERR